MQLTRAADYAVRVMIHLAGMPMGTRASRNSLAEMAEVPPQFMGKVLQELIRAELIRSHRGARGGFEIGRPPAEITLLQIVEAIEGPICLNFCLGREDNCGRRWWCSAHLVWREAQAALVGVLGGAKLDELAKVAMMRLEAERATSREVAAWI